MALKELSGLAERFQAAEQRLTQAEQQREQAETAFEAARNIFLQQQAAFLATRLQSGSPCPVCGSPDHPRPATGDGNAASESELKALEQTLKTARTEAEQCKRQFDEIGGERQKQQLMADLLLEALAAELRQSFVQIAAAERLNWLREARTALQSELRELRQQLLRLERLKEREQQLTADIDGKNRLSEQLEQQAKQLAEARSELLVAVRAEQELLRQLEAELPQTVRSQPALAEALRQNQAELQALQAALEQAAEARSTGELADQPIQCYRLTGEGAENLQVGDAITVEGILKNYKGTIEFDKGCVLVGYGEIVSQKAIVDAAYALESGVAMTAPTALVGEVVSIDSAWSDEYQNITVTIVCDGLTEQPIQCYRLSGEGAQALEVGSVVGVYGTIKNYKGTIEFDKGCTLDAVVKAE